MPPRKPLDHDLQTKQLPDKFYLAGFDYSKVRPESSRVELNFGRRKEEGRGEEKEVRGSMIDDKDLSGGYWKLGHWKRVLSADWRKGMGRREGRAREEGERKEGGGRKEEEDSREMDGGRVDEEGRREEKGKRGKGGRKEDSMNGRGWSGGSGWKAKGMRQEVKFYQKEKIKVR